MYSREVEMVVQIWAREYEKEQKRKIAKRTERGNILYILNRLI